MLCIYRQRYITLHYIHCIALFGIDSVTVALTLTLTLPWTWEWTLTSTLTCTFRFTFTCACAVAFYIYIYIHYIQIPILMCTSWLQSNVEWPFMLWGTVRPFFGPTFVTTSLARGSFWTFERIRWWKAYWRGGIRIEKGQPWRSNREKTRDIVIWYNMI